MALFRLESLVLSELLVAVASCTSLLIYIYVEAPQSFIQDTEGKVLGQVLGLLKYSYIYVCVYVH